MLVAFRDTSEDGHRTRLWDFVRERMAREHPGFEIVAGTDDGVDPFNKCQAINRAAREASGDSFYICDSDTWVPPAHVEAAVAGLEVAPGRWWRPWHQKVKLNQPATEAVLDAGPENWDGGFDPRQRFENRNTYWAAPPLMLHRILFDEVGGMDERFRGWGHEDDAFAWSLKALFGEAEVVHGQCVHLFHPRIGRSGHDLWPGQTVYGSNIELAQAYRRAASSPERMRELIAAR